MGDVIRKLQETRIISKVDFERHEVWVRPLSWKIMTYEEKETLARLSAIHLETRTNGPRSVTLRDTMDGHELATYSKTWGFSINN